ncbi:hypothetical protein [Pseudomonas xanthosomatis]|uniref:hypothetical protein n=1 Tax=Pseudomonas xanthosomatis TaxID=2842356 RepID=UPI003511D8BB
MGLVNQTGFDAVASGTLSESWRQQPGNPVYCTDLTEPEIGLALSKANRATAPKHRDEIITILANHVGSNSFDQLTEENNAFLLRVNRDVTKGVWLLLYGVMRF